MNHIKPFFAATRMCWFQLLAQIVGYGLLFVTDFNICLGVFLIHWVINITIKETQR